MHLHNVRNWAPADKSLCPSSSPGSSRIASVDNDIDAITKANIKLKALAHISIHTFMRLLNKCQLLYDQVTQS